MTIAAYLIELDRELRLRRAPRSRLLAEVEDHLIESRDELVRTGTTPADAESQAVARFGAAATVAERFAHATASTSAHSAVCVTAIALGAYIAVLFAFASASPLLRDFPQGAPSFFASQLAAVAFVAALVRSLRWRRDAAVPSAELVAIARAATVTTLSLAVAAVAETALALTRPAGVIVWSEGRWLAVGFGAAAIVIVAAALTTVRASVQAAAVARPADHADPAELLAEDLDTLAARVRLPRPVRHAVATSVAHPWRATFVVAVLAFAMGSLEGGAAVGSLEAALIVAIFGLLGRTIGLRPARRSLGDRPVL